MFLIGKYNSKKYNSYEIYLITHWSIKELDYLAKMIKVIVTLQQGPKQQLFGFPKIHAHHSM